MSNVILQPDVGRASLYHQSKAIPIKYLRSDGSITVPDKTGIEVLPPSPERAALWAKAAAKPLRCLYPDGSVYDNDSEGAGGVGPQGPQGEQGIRGDKGDRGDIGPQGPSGTVVLDEGGETLAYRSDGYLFRITSQVSMNIASGASGNLLQGFTFPANIERMANTLAEEWDITPNGALVFRAIDGYVDLVIDARLTGSISGVGPGSIGTFELQLVRPVGGVDTVAVSQDMINMGTLTAKNISFESYTHTITDPFITDGVRIVLTNTSASTITITGITVVIKGTQH